MAAYSDIESHRGMALDAVRNAAYAKALRGAIAPGCSVLDLGAGLGIHGLLAAGLGAGKVYLVDPSPVVRHAADLARHNGLEQRVEVIRGRIEEIVLPQRVDLIVSVLTGNFLLTEDLLPLLLHARDHWLKPGGRLLPGRARMRAALVSAASFHAEHVGGWSEPACGLDFSPLRSFAANTVFYGAAANIGAELLSQPVTLAEIDFATADTADCKCRFNLQASQGGTCHGLLGWFDMQLGDEWLSTGPQAEPMHWSLAFLPLDPPLDLQAGETLHGALDRPEYGEWTWAIEREGTSQRHSTFHSQLVDIMALKAKADAFVPGLGERGELALFVLGRMADGCSTGEILQAARATFADGWPLQGQLERTVRSLVSRWQASKS